MGEAPGRCERAGPRRTPAARVRRRRSVWRWRRTTGEREGGPGQRPSGRPGAFARGRGRGRGRGRRAWTLHPGDHRTGEPRRRPRHQPLGLPPQPQHRIRAGAGLRPSVRSGLTCAAGQGPIVPSTTPTGRAPRAAGGRGWAAGGAARRHRRCRGQRIRQARPAAADRARPTQPDAGHPLGAGQDGIDDRTQAK
jgi:hypothetical protein